MLCTCSLSAQTPEWVRSVGDSTGNTLIHAMSVCQTSHILFAGSFDGRSLILGSETLKNAGREDAFAAVLDEAGNVSWASSFGGSGEDIATAIACDNIGNIYVAMNFGSLSITIGSNTLFNRGESDGALIKLNAEKEVEWVWHLGNAGKDEITGVVTDRQGNIYVSGYTIDGIGPRQATAFVVKMDDAKNILWQRKGAGGDVQLTSIVLDDDQNCYLAGSVWDRVTFDGGYELRSGMARNAFIVQYSPVGSFMKGVLDSNYSKINAMVSHSNSIYAAGEKVNMYMGWGWPLMDSKIILTKYDQNLDISWEAFAGGETEGQSLDVVNDIAVDESGNLYMTGYYFSENIAFGQDTLENIWNRNYFYQQVFVLKYDSSGQPIWGKSLGGDMNDRGTVIAVVGEDAFFLGGNFESDRIHFGQYVLINEGSTREIYVHLRPPRYGRNPISFLAHYHTAIASVTPPGAHVLATLYPNPAKEYFNIRPHVSTGYSGTLHIYTIDGRLIHTQTIQPTETDIRVSTGMMHTGVYLLAITIGNHVEVHRFVRH